MQNPGSYRLIENFNEDDRFFSDGLASVIDTDYVLNYLNDPESAQRRSISNQNLFGQVLPEMQLPFPGFPDPQKPPESLQNIYGKINIQDPWLRQNVGDGSNLQYGPQPTMNFKVENPEEFDGNTKIKKVKTNRNLEINKVHAADKNNKGNIKNTYINKINSLITDPKYTNPENTKGPSNQIKADVKKHVSIKNEVTTQNPTQVKMGMKKVRSCDVLKSDELEKLNMKLAKNRESARNSRIRKKVYIELLEKTVDQLQTELVTARKQLENNSSNLNKVSFQSKPMHNLHTAKQQLFERLEKMVDGKADESEVSFLIDSLRLRFGASGKERVDVVNYMFKQIVEFLVPVHMKYLLWVATQNKDLFNTPESIQANGFLPPGTQIENTEYWTELHSSVNLSESQRKHLLRYKKKLLGEKQKFESLVHNLNSVRKNVLKQANSLQSVVDDFRNYLTPTQTAKLLLVLEREKNRKEFSAEKLWNTVTMKKETHDGSELSDNFLDEDEAFSQGELEDGDESQKMIEIVPSIDYMEQGK